MKCTQALTETEFGSDSQAVIDIYSRSITDTRFGGKLNSLILLYSQAFLEGNIGKRGYWYAFGRRSYMGPLFELLPRLAESRERFGNPSTKFLELSGKSGLPIN